jgi:choline kinase
MKAYIYAAGRGLRLGPKLGERAKILLEFDGRSVLDWHAERLVACGVREAAVIVGYQREVIAAQIPAIRQRHGITLHAIENEAFTEGSVLSLAVSVPDIVSTGRPALVMDGDVLYPATLLRRLIDSAQRTVLLLDRNYSTADDDPVLVPVLRGKPFDFMKRWQGSADQVGESIGFFKVDPADFPALARAVEARTQGERRRESYDEVLRDMVRAGLFACEDVTGVPWTEIDFPEDVERARTEVLPAILAWEQAEPRRQAKAP